MKNLYWNAVVKMHSAKAAVNCAALKKEKGGSEYLAFIVLCILVLGVGVAFNTELPDFFTDFLPKLTNKANDILL